LGFFAMTNFLAGCVAWAEFLGLCAAFVPLAWEFLK
jgi:hypothetical protein